MSFRADGSTAGGASTKVSLPPFREQAGGIGGADVHVMTWNVRRILPTLRRGSPDAWRRRAPLLHLLVGRERPDVLAVQEALPEHLLVLGDALGPRYQRLGRGRDADGGDEHCALFVDRERLEVLSWRQLALSRTPGIAGSRAWGAPFPRIATVARVRSRSTGAELQLINTHLDPFSPRSRVKSAELLRALVLESPAPTVLTGDANAKIGSPAFRALIAGGALEDSWSAAARRLTPEWRTFSNYRPPRPGARIDWLLVSPALEVKAAAVSALRIDGRAASDHEPVQALLRVPSQGVG